MFPLFHFQGHFQKKYEIWGSLPVARGSLLEARKRSAKVGPGAPEIDPKSTKICPKVAPGGPRAPGNGHRATGIGQRPTGIGHRARRSGPDARGSCQGCSQVPRAQVPYIKADIYNEIAVRGLSSQEGPHARTARVGPPKPPGRATWAAWPIDLGRLSHPELPRVAPSRSTDLPRPSKPTGECPQAASTDDFRSNLGRFSRFFVAAR